MELKDFEYNFIDRLYDYDGLWGRKAKCGLKVQGNIVIVTDLYKSNPGGSITEYCAELAMIICNEYSIKYENLKLIHHTPKVHSSHEFLEEVFYSLSFDLINGELKNPDWTQIERSDTEQLLKDKHRPAKKKSWQLRLGIILILACIPFFLILPAFPFLDFSTKTKVILSTTSLIIGEVLFWGGGLLVGKELLTKYKAYLNPKKWFDKKTKLKQ